MPWVVHHGVGEHEPVDGPLGEEFGVPLETVGAGWRGEEEYVEAEFGGGLGDRVHELREDRVEGGHWSDAVAEEPGRPRTQRARHQIGFW